jgi:hypothetical protein
MARTFFLAPILRALRSIFFWLGREVVLDLIFKRGGAGVEQD